MVTMSLTCFLSTKYIYYFIAPSIIGGATSDINNVATTRKQSWVNEYLLWNIQLENKGIVLFGLIIYTISNSREPTTKLRAICWLSSVN